MEKFIEVVLGILICIAISYASSRIWDFDKKKQQQKAEKEAEKEAQQQREQERINREKRATCPKCGSCTKIPPDEKSSSCEGFETRSRRINTYYNNEGEERGHTEEDYLAPTTIFTHSWKFKCDGCGNAWEARETY